jgi:cytochrome c
MNMEFNKAFAAILTAGIIAYFCGLASHGLVHSEHPKEDAFHIEAAEVAAAPGAAAAPAEAEPIDALMATADITAGEKASKVCGACHSFEKGGPNRVGPDLFGIVGRTVGSHEGFAYSDAMKNHGGTWDQASLNSFLWNPKKHVPGTKMTFAGIKKPEDRAALIKWLEAQK